jgi:3-hydroxyisobutyrate dehydrogenase-like beta-hydroxyacid dehydrogenase
VRGLERTPVTTGSHEDSMNTDTKKAPVTVIGLGLMGAALARAFLKAGHPTTVWNRSAKKAEDLVASGATRAATLTEAIRASPLVVVCVLDHDAVREVLRDVGDAFTGRVFVNLTSETPAQARQTAAWASARGLEYLDGAIMDIPQGVGRSEAMLLFSGSRAAFTDWQPVLSCLGTGTYLGADAGLAALYDLALLCIMWSTLSGFFHAAALVGTEQVAATAFTRMATGWLTAVAGFLPRMAEQVDSGEYETDVSTLGISAVGLGHLVHASEEQGLTADVPGPIKALFDRAVAKGHGGHALASLVEVIRRPKAE